MVFCTARRRWSALPGDEEPGHPSDMHATIMHLMGINPKTAFDVERPPFYVTQDGEGQPVMDVMA